MKVLIDISQEMFKATQTYYSDNTTRLSIKSCIEKIANGTPIPEGATNGDMIKAMFPNASVSEKFPIGNYDEVYYVFIEFTDGVINEMRVMKSWWNAPYKGVEE